MNVFFDIVIVVDVYCQCCECVFVVLCVVGGGVVIVFIVLEMLCNCDIVYLYWFDSYFYYLMGFIELDVVFVLNVVVLYGVLELILFCCVKNVDCEIWEGFYYGFEVVCDVFGFDVVFVVDVIDIEMLCLFVDVGIVYYWFGVLVDFECQFVGWFDVVCVQVCVGVVVLDVLFDFMLLFDDMWFVKDEYEFVIMMCVVYIFVFVYCCVMQVCCFGICEYEFEVELLYLFCKYGVQVFVYGLIVVAGVNVCVLYYLVGNVAVWDGDLILIDVVCEFDGYVFDIICIFLVNGCFLFVQCMLYDIVFVVQQVVIDVMCVGVLFEVLYDVVVCVFVQGLFDIGIILKMCFLNVDDVIVECVYMCFYMYCIGYWFGMDVYDCGDYCEWFVVCDVNGVLLWCMLKFGMMFIVEFGLYVCVVDDVLFEYWNIGICIEDDVIVCEYGCELIMCGVLVVVDEIEVLMCVDV